MLSNKEQKERKSRVAAVAGTILFHGLVLIALLLPAMRTPLPLTKGYGVEVNLDFKGEGINSGITNIPSWLPRNETGSSNEKPGVTTKKEKNSRLSKNKNLVKSALPDGYTSTPFGTVDGEKGISLFYFLGKREAQMIPEPGFHPTQPGKMIVSINVNREGKVTYASAGAKGTTIYGARYRQQAEQAARNSLFAPDPLAPETQRGIISYAFTGLE